MKRLGYTRYGAQGGDWGAVITDQMGVQAPPELIGIHTNMAGAVPSNISKAIQTGGPMPFDLSAEEKHVFERLKFFFTKGVAYALEIGKPPTDTIWNCRFASWLSRLDPRPRLA